jgi:hypothetical protein
VEIFAHHCAEPDDDDDRRDNFRNKHRKPLFYSFLFAGFDPGLVVRMRSCSDEFLTKRAA